MKQLLTLLIFQCLLYACKEEKKDPKPTSLPAFIVAMQQQAKQYPDSIGLHLNLINAMDSLRLYKEAITEADYLISKDSLNYGFWFTKGKLQQKASDTPNAIISLHRAARIYANPEALLALANLYAETKNTRVFEVCNLVDEMKMGRVFDSYTSFFKGVYYARLGQAEKAIALFDQSINYNYTLLDNYIEKGALLFEGKKINEAIQVFKTASTINNTFADAYYWQGKCAEALGNKADAVTNYEKAVALDKEMTEAAAALTRLK
jgi:tetratricopeptide (TPR) repeat protein